MICPVCNIAMIVAEQNKVELDHCVKCRGVWFDREELDLFMASRKLSPSSIKMRPLDEATNAKTREGKRRCPRCGKAMKKTLAMDAPEVLIDRCAKGDGLWFDGGEIDEVVRQATASDPMASFIGNVFRFSGGKL